MKINRKSPLIYATLIAILSLLIPFTSSHALSKSSMRSIEESLSARASKNNSAQAANPTTVVLTLAELAKLDPNSSTSLQGNNARARYDLLLPAEWDIQRGSKMRLHVLTNIERASPGPAIQLLVLLNGQWVYETVVAVPGEQWIDFSFPEVWGLREGRAERLEILVSTHTGCEQNFIQSTNIFFDSQLTLIYNEKPLTFDLAKYPAPIYEPAFFQETIRIAIPDNPSTLETEAALALAAELGNSSNESLDILAVKNISIEQAATLDTNLIIIGTPDNNPIIGQLQSIATLPATVQPRRFELSTTGPDIILPSTNLTYSVEVKNTENQVAENLILRSRLPSDINIDNLTCVPDCQQTEDHVSWNIDALNSAATTKFTISFTIPPMPNIGREYFDLTSELLQGMEILNVNTLNSLIAENGSPQLIISTQKGQQFLISNGSAIAETDGLVQLIPSPWYPNRGVLIVTGSTSEGAYKAGRALATESSFPGFGGQLALIRDVRPTENISFEFIPEITLNQLGYSDQVLTGAGTNSVSYRFYLPAQFYLSKDSKIRFFFSHSSLLDPTTSFITLTMNGSPFASVLLDESNTERGSIEAYLPTSVARPGEINSLGVTVNAQVPNPCGIASGTNQLWVNLQSESVLSLPVVDNPVANNFDLKRLPMPLVLNPNLDQTKIVLPEKPSDLEYTVAFRLAAWLGSHSVGNNFNPHILVGMPASEEELTTYNLIVIGRPSRNTMLQLLNNDLPQPFVLGKDVIRQQVDNIVLRMPEELDLGYIQLLSSKWNQSNVIIAITGTTDLSLGRAVDALIDDKKNNLIKGNLVLLPNDSDVLATDTRKFLPGSKLNALGTAIPGIAIIETMTPVSAVETATAPTELPDQGTIQNRPGWLPIVATIVGAVLTIIVMGVLYTRIYRRQR